MKNKTRLILLLSLMGLAVVSSIVAAFFAMDPYNAGKEPLFNLVFWFTAAMIVFSFAAILVFLIIRLVTEKKLVKALIGLAATAVICVILYLISNGQDINIAKYDISESVSRLIGAACYLCYILVGVAVVLMIALSFIPTKIGKKK